jgi:hypothetical protein
MTDAPEAPVGYRAPILRGVWERIKTLGVLRIFSHVWVACCLALGLWTITYLGFRWLALPVVLWLAGHCGLFLLTQWNDKWDDMFLAQLVRNYKDRYDAA